MQRVPFAILFSAILMTTASLWVFVSHHYHLFLPALFAREFVRSLTTNYKNNHGSRQHPQILQTQKGNFRIVTMPADGSVPLPHPQQHQHPNDDGLCDTFVGPQRHLCIAYCEDFFSKATTASSSSGKRRFPCVTTTRCPCWTDLIDWFAGSDASNNPMDYHHFYQSSHKETYGIGTCGQALEVGALSSTSSSKSHTKGCMCFTRAREPRWQYEFHQEQFSDQDQIHDCVRDIVVLAKTAHQLLPGSLPKLACQARDLKNTTAPITVETTTTTTTSTANSTSDTTTTTTTTAVTSTASCPCWDGTQDPTIFPPTVPLGDGGTTFHYDSIYQNTKTGAATMVWNIGTCQYTASNHTCMQVRHNLQEQPQQLPYQRGNSQYHHSKNWIEDMEEKQSKACYNDLLAQSAAHGANKCHWYT